MIPCGWLAINDVVVRLVKARKGLGMLSLKIAQEIINKGISKAEELQQNVTIAVVDEHGELVALSKMDGALVVSPHFAQSKAKTSALLGLDTQQIGQYAQPGQPYFGITDAFGGVLMTIAGGTPIKNAEGKILGGVGVGGSYDVKMDAEIATSSLI